MKRAPEAILWGGQAGRIKELLPEHADIGKTVQVLTEERITLGWEHDFLPENVKALLTKWEWKIIVQGLHTARAKQIPGIKPY